MIYFLIAFGGMIVVALIGYIVETTGSNLPDDYTWGKMND